MGAGTLTYDKNGNLTGDGTKTYTYNALSELTSVTTPGGTITYGYNALGQRVSMTAGGVTTNFTIDPLSGMVVGEANSSGTVLADNVFGLGLVSRVASGTAGFYTFDGTGNTSELSGPAGTVLDSYSYLPFGEQLTATGNTPNPFTFNGAVGAASRGDGLAFMTHRSYEPALGRFTSPDPLGFGGGDANLYRFVHNSPVMASDPSGLFNIPIGNANFNIPIGNANLLSGNLVTSGGASGSGLPFLSASPVAQGGASGGGLPFLSGNPGDVSGLGVPDPGLLSPDGSNDGYNSDTPTNDPQSTTPPDQLDVCTLAQSGSVATGGAFALVHQAAATHPLSTAPASSFPFPAGTVQLGPNQFQLPNGTVVDTNPEGQNDGSALLKYPNGTSVEQNPDGSIASVALPGGAAVDPGNIATNAFPSGTPGFFVSSSKVGSVFAVFPNGDYVDANNHEHLPGNATPIATGDPNITKVQFDNGVIQTTDRSGSPPQVTLAFPNDAGGITLNGSGSSFPPQINQVGLQDGTSVQFVTLGGGPPGVSITGPGTTGLIDQVDGSYAAGTAGTGSTNGAVVVHAPDGSQEINVSTGFDAPFSLAGSDFRIERKPHGSTTIDDEGGLLSSKGFKVQFTNGNNATFTAPDGSQGNVDLNTGKVTFTQPPPKKPASTNACGATNPGGSNLINDIIGIIFFPIPEIIDLSAHDPNAITGPSGFGAQGFVSGGETLPYRVDFTNESTATAPAQTVTVTQQLSANLDLSTFQLGDIGFGGTTMKVPAGRTSYSTQVTLPSTAPGAGPNGLLVDVSAALNPQTGLVTWTFTSLDPATLDLPSNPLEGFLPPDDKNGDGEGFVNYTVKPKASDTTGTAVNAQATVVFDVNAPINTKQIVNTIDAAPPTSSVAALPAFSQPTFTVSWSGTDDAGGSGIASYSVFVSDNGGPFTSFVLNTTATSATFTGQAGHSYAFYSVATDNVGNVQATPTAAQTSTLVPQPPSSSVTALPATETTASFTISWSGSDAGGPGIATYSLFVSDNGGPFTAFQTATTQTSATFTGQPGHSYGFYSVATDTVGNVQTTTTAAQATTTVNPVPFTVTEHSYVIGSGTITVSAADGLLKGDTGPTQLTVTAGSVTGAQGGTFTIDADGSFTYTPGASFPGFDNAQFTVTDTSGNKGTATVNVLSQHAGVVWKFYESVLNREPEPAGLQFWTNYFNNGGSTGDMAFGFFESDELLDKVLGNYYQQFLLRPLDQGGLTFWKGVWHATGGPEQIKAGFADSPEFYASSGGTPDSWIDALYQRVLSRTPDPGGKTFWLNYYEQQTAAGVDAGTVRYQIALGFFDSAESYGQDVAGWFQEYLFRAPTDAEKAQYIGQMEGGASDRTIEQAITNLPEYASNPPEPAAGAATPLGSYYPTAQSRAAVAAKDAFFSGL